LRKIHRVDRGKLSSRFEKGAISWRISFRKDLGHFGGIYSRNRLREATMRASAARDEADVS
jgi:hypothetical protein